MPVMMKMTMEMMINIAIEWTRTVWDPNNRTSSSWLEMMSMLCHGLGSSWLNLLRIPLSNATSTLIHSSSLRVGQIWWGSVIVVLSGFKIIVILSKNSCHFLSLLTYLDVRSNLVFFIVIVLHCKLKKKYFDMICKNQI